MYHWGSPQETHWHTEVGYCRVHEGHLLKVAGAESPRREGEPQQSAALRILACPGGHREGTILEPGVGVEGPKPSTSMATD